MKKGLSYIDISISEGIFILYFLFVFVTLRPGIKEDISGNYLLQIVQRGFYDKVFINVSKYPLFIDYHTSNPSCDPESTNDPCIIELEDFPFNWVENTTLVKDNATVLNFNITNDSRTDLINLSFKTNRIRFSKPTPDIFYLLHSPDFNLSINPNEPPVDERPRIISGVNLDYKIGVKEILYGIGKDKLINLNKDYNALKNEIKYPTDKEFSITIYDGSNPQNAIYNYTGIIANQTEKYIFVLQWSDVLINNEGNTVPVIINLRAW